MDDARDDANDEKVEQEDQQLVEDLELPEGEGEDVRGGEMKKLK